MKRTVPTIKEIAKRLNISVSTVSRALHNHHSIGLRTKMRVQELAKELNYEPNQTAIFFKQGKTFTIGVILPHLSESFFSSAISGIEDFAKTKKYNVLVGQSHDDEETEKQLVEAMKNHRVDGMLISVAKNTKNYSHFDMLKNYDIPLVFFDRIPKKTDIHYVACNLENGMSNAIHFLVKRGHKNIALINGPQTIIASRERLEAYKDALARKRIKIDAQYIISTNLSAADTHKAMEELLSLKRRPTAIITFNDYVALDAMQFAKRNGIALNEDISFVSFANLPICHYMENPPLASVEQFPYEQGYKAASLLLALLDSPDEETKEFQNEILESKLVVHMREPHTPSLAQI
ncbi:MAG TPA: LacI family DNA-binding transcriptional regulator [Chitinophagaceae bacterium]|nr:LacI family DNA-binding transcriptional regulator [Chitinophagaceae bacterium]